MDDRHIEEVGGGVDVDFYSLESPVSEIDALGSPCGAGSDEIGLWNFGLEVVAVLEACSAIVLFDQFDCESSIGEVLPVAEPDARGSGAAVVVGWESGCCEGG